MREARTFWANGKDYTYTLTRKKVKNYNLRVMEDGTLHVSAPTSAPLWQIEAFLARHAAHVDRARERLEKRREARPTPLLLRSGESLPLWGIPHTVCVIADKKRHAYLDNGTLYLAVRDPESLTERQKCFAELLAREASEKLTARTAALLPLFAPKPAKMPAVTVRTMKSKWGVCRPREGRVTLNRSLVYLPPLLVDYVICHELAHFHHADHSKRFWAFLASVMPDHRARRKALNAFPIPLLGEEKEPASSKN